ncbi:MAG: hypothetical protein COV74_00235 [Candidatus Omnitrophica bacterium CG11_big_fil_rev_8_21_14_0_20_45_26]|uniref:Uncharacterized protein n=1 Tax=Candidatus Abzuiibacterium crystallinum TaxID=1974748 RepID=A0A2H0LV17_9BACT|nr:MAG: hypothetical protein COV74_00235 [Candidatus Omnitrophica bacterium CG11_big_fil_rev_8_21_14_0_20_45_26]PIW64633.1 MAG: hypothetical protein COW12_05540 [Candidatus Omnitrophica bacterium CG12_big_fil_rev_8_21_14_0_65_45_16]
MDINQNGKSEESFDPVPHRFEKVKESLHHEFNRLRAGETAHSALQIVSRKIIQISNQTKPLSQTTPLLRNLADVVLELRPERVSLIQAAEKLLKTLSDRLDSEKTPIVPIPHEVRVPKKRPQTMIGMRMKSTPIILNPSQLYAWQGIRKAAKPSRWQDARSFT